MTARDRNIVRQAIDKARRAQLEASERSYRVNADAGYNKRYGGQPKYHRTCTQCGAHILAKRPHARFCDRRCYKRWWHAHHPEGNTARAERKKAARLNGRRAHELG